VCRIDAEALTDCSIGLDTAAAKLRSPSFVLVRGTTDVGTLAERRRLSLLTSLANLVPVLQVRGSVKSGTLTLPS